MILTNSTTNIKALAVAFLLLIIVNYNIAQDTTVGLIYNDESKSFNGYTLFAPNTSTTTYLIDNNGKLVNKWESEYNPGLSAYLLEDGNLLRSAKVKDPTESSALTGGFQKFNWEGTVLWEYYYGRQHHDIESLPNGNVLLVTNDPKNKSNCIEAGRDSNLIGTNPTWRLRSLSIIEIEQTSDTTGNIVWQWNAWDHLIQDFDPSKDNFGVVSEHPELMNINFVKDGGQDWLHTNSVAYNENLDQILVSNRNTNEIWIIDHSTTDSDILYRWGNPIAYGAGATDDQKLFEQHDAHWVGSNLQGAGNILIFSNGTNRPDGEYSSVVEILPPININNNYDITTGSAYGPTELFWGYTKPEPTDFYSPRYGGSQRLPNGNTLICNSDKGEFLEVTTEDEIVWSYISPVTSDGIIEQGTVTVDSVGNWIPNNQVFRCYKYGENYPGFDGIELNSGHPLKINNDQNKVTNFNLYNNYPNPFNPITNINFSLDEESLITISIFDILGNKVRTLTEDIYVAGFHTIAWDSVDEAGRLMSSGVYLYTIQNGQQVQTKKMILLR